ncbi:glutathione S-transferase family protein [Acinetobacter shaoyimingii]|uniref:Glutathione S-transferase family protein n=1 Tax=Acinetobacter shaoyimingii TaxID=2715164 RepID=A0A6G8RWH1_9GAMM|nr:glutathione S-transferase family protein [Acinetobacter shaoyimingii]NHB57245.1 glutathione S-transferase family protein [Acinetobacter shaoyimingii]QIO06148.1 glutathione S-transferase family protein [Acinetobacter shaoyimingii]
MRLLYQFPLSHFCEKARWLLDHKELDFVAHNLIPGVHRAFAQLKTGQNTLPILKDNDRWIADSTQIALYLDDTYPEHALLRFDPKLRQQALDINQICNELGRYVRRWGLAHTFTVSDEPLEIMIGEKGYLRKFQRFSKPIIKNLVAKGYKLDSEKVSEAKTKMDEIVADLNQRLIENGGRYLVGDRLGLADIAVCSMLAPLLEIEGTPWERDIDATHETEYQEYKMQLLDLPLGQYIKRIYANERNARVDWRGI